MSSTSSPEQHDAQSSSGEKGGRRLNKSCDLCRRRKVRCDGPELMTSDQTCSNCAKANAPCTYSHTTQRRRRQPSTRALVENILSENKQLRGMLDEVRGPQSTPLCAKCNTPSQSSRANSGEPDLDSDQLDPRPHTPTSDRSADELSETAEEPLLYPAADQNHPSELGPELSPEARFFGKSSSVHLVKELLDLQPQPGSDESHVFGAASVLNTAWSARPWEEALKPPSQRRHFPFQFPEDDLMRSLLDFYWEYCNLYLPFLHRPFFEAQVADKLHHRDTGFACVLLLVCALGARYSDDPRVLSPETHLWQSAGWKWFNQAHATPRHVLDPVTLDELHFYLLSADFIHYSSLPSMGWTILGTAIRRAQDIGAHRKDTFKRKPPLHQELWRRVWWALVISERLASGACGRPSVAGVAESDVELPTMCDDEYWDVSGPVSAWRQPEGVPAHAIAFKCMIELSEILAHALSLLYKLRAPRKPDQKRSSQESALDLVVELDSQLNHWVDSIPEHLKWDPKQTNLVWKRQSLVLYCSYYSLQIAIHRPFISTPKMASKFNFPSLSICTNAARASLHLVDLTDKECIILGSELLWPLLVSCSILVLNVWTGRRAGLSPDTSKDMKEVWKAMRFYHELEKRLFSATMIRSILVHLISASDLPLPPDDAGEPAFSGLAASGSGAQAPPHPMPGRGYNATTRASSQEGFGVFSTEADLRNQSMANVFPGQAQSMFFGSLPVYSQELGQLCVWPQGPDFSTHAPTSSYPSTSPATNASDLSFNTDPPTRSTSHGMSSQNSIYSAHPSTAYHSGTTYPASFEDSGDLGGIGSSSATQTLPAQADVPDMFDADTLQLWTETPFSFQMDRWGEYISNVNEIQMSNTFDQLNFNTHST